MAIKRLSSSPKPPASQRRRASSRRTTVNVENEPLFSANEKRQLILAHAAMRRPQDPLQMMSAWAGIAIALVVIAVGWWWSSGSILINTASSIAPEMRMAFKDVPPLGAKQDDGSGRLDFKEALKLATDKLRVMDVQAATRQKTLDGMAALVASSTQAAQRTDLFQPSQVTSSTTVTSTTLLKP